MTIVWNNSHSENIEKLLKRHVTKSLGIIIGNINQLKMLHSHLNGGSEITFGGLQFVEITITENITPNMNHQGYLKANQPWTPNIVQWWVQAAQQAPQISSRCSIELQHAEQISTVLTTAWHSDHSNEWGTVVCKLCTVTSVAKFHYITRQYLMASNVLITTASTEIWLCAAEGLSEFWKYIQHPKKHKCGICPRKNN